MSSGSENLVTADSLTLADYTNVELIVPRLRERDAAGIISELSHSLQREGAVPDVLQFYHNVLNHELMANSAHGRGIAIPHGRLSGVKQLGFAFGRCADPVVWGGKNGSAVQLVFLLAVPATDAARYLHLLARIARLSEQPQTLLLLQSATTAEEVLDVLETIALR